ncbi:MAG: ComEC/Rec2 family competence protein, partial [Candidatus Limnocylindrales bacterium]
MAVPRASWLALGAVTAAVGSVALADAAGFSVALLLLSLGTAGAGAAALLGPAHRGSSAAVVAFGAGLALVALRVAVGGVIEPPARATELPAGVHDWSARVESVGTPADGRQHAIVLGTAEAGAAVRLWVELPRFPEVVPGDLIRFRAAADAAPDAAPDDAGFASYLARADVAGTATSATLAVAGHAGDPAAILGRIRDWLGDRLTSVLPEPQAGLAAGIVVGLRERVARDVAADFTTAGLSHIVAISGWNIALVGGVLAALLRALPRRRRSLAVLAAIVAYTLLAGAGPSVVRAALMAGLVLVARDVGRPGRAAAVLGLAVALMLLLDPRTVADPGFQLSAAATAGLIVWSGPLGAGLAHRLPARTPRWLLETLAVSLAAQAATLPLVLFDFGRLSLVAPLANLAAVPLVTPVMAAGFAATLAGTLAAAGLPDVLTRPISALGSLAVGLLIALARAAASVPFASITLPGPAATAAAAFVAIVLATASSERGRRSGRALG